MIVVIAYSAAILTVAVLVVRSAGTFVILAMTTVIFLIGGLVGLVAVENGLSSADPASLGMSGGRTLEWNLFLSTPLVAVLSLATWLQARFRAVYWPRQQAISAALFVAAISGVGLLQVLGLRDRAVPNPYAGLTLTMGLEPFFIAVSQISFLSLLIFLIVSTFRRISRGPA